MRRNGKSDRGQSHLHDTATLSEEVTTDHGEGEIMPAGVTITRLPEHRLSPHAAQRYVAPMGTAITANDVAAGLRDHLHDQITYLPDRKLHALLYLAQGVWLAVEDDPLYPDAITATDIGVHVSGIDDTPSSPLDDGRFAVVTAVCSRYGGLSAMDLESLIRGQGPWSAAGTGNPISIDAICKVFRDQDETPEGTTVGIPRSARTRMHPPHQSDTARPEPDSAEEIAAFIAEVKTRM